MNIEQLSSKYKVRKLVDKDIPDILSLCIKNEIYYKYCPPRPSIETIKEDMSVLPPRKTLEDKYYIGFYDDNRLIAIMDLIDKCPDENTCFIGFFMLEKDMQAKGIGSLIIDEVLTYIKSHNYKEVRLGWVIGNKQAESFWKKIGFIPIKETHDQNEYSVMLAGKEL